MAKLILGSLLVFFCIQPDSSSVPARPTQGHLTPAESQGVQEVISLFMKRLEETADLSLLFDDLYVADFIQRYVKQQQANALKDKARFNTILFVSGLEYKAELLARASHNDWRRLYVASYNLLYYGLAAGLNRMAKDLLSGKQPDVEALKDIYPQKVVKLLDQHPILNNLLIKKEKAKPISTLEEMQSVIATLEQVMALLREGENKKPLFLTDELKRLFELLRQPDLAQISVEITDGEFFGYPRGTRIFYAQTPIMLQLIIVKADGKYKIVWTEIGPGK